LGDNENNESGDDDDDDERRFKFVVVSRCALLFTFLLPALSRWLVLCSHNERVCIYTIDNVVHAARGAFREYLGPTAIHCAN
jgi:hypothetical protein